MTLSLARTPKAGGSWLASPLIHTGSGRAMRVHRLPAGIDACVYLQVGAVLVAKPKCVSLLTLKDKDLTVACYGQEEFRNYSGR